MNNLTIKGFINEMSYKNSLEELDNIVVDYQDVLIDYFVNNQYNIKVRNEFNEVCEVIRSDSYFDTFSALVYEENSKIKPDMAFVIYSATNFRYVDGDLKGKALELGYHLRSQELGDVVNDVATNTCILIASTKAVREYESSPFTRSKFVENILTTLPEVLYNAYGQKYKANEIPTSVIFVILSKAVLDLEPENIITAFCKTEFPENLDKDIKPFALRLRSFLYTLCGRISEDKLRSALAIACKSMKKFNDRHGANESLRNKYLDYRLLAAIVKAGENREINVPSTMKSAYYTMKKFKEDNPRFEHLF